MCIYRKYKHAKYLDSDKENHFSKEKYRPYHRKLQKKDHLFDMDCFWIDVNDDDEEPVMYVGINKKIIDMDFKSWHDRMKDGN